MSNRWLRFVIAVLALAAAGGAVYRVLQQEQRLAAEIARSAAADRAAESALVTAADLRGALHAYVAAGQGLAFWTSRAATLSNRLRSSLLELDEADAASGAAVAEALDVVDRLEAAEQRARAHARQGQALLAGEVIFTEGRDLLDTVRLEIARLRERLDAASRARLADARREQLYLALGAAGVLALAVIVLVPPGRSAARHEAPADVTSDPEAEAADAVTPEHAAAAEAAPDPADVLQPTPAPLTVPAPPAATVPATVRLGEAAALCTDLARASESGEIAGLLTRASAVLNASGIIVWLAAADRQTLVPAAASGYPDELFTRIGAIPRDATNLTAQAFREETSRTSPRQSAAAAAALAVPLVTPQGAVGVLSAELRDLGDVDPQQVALARIFAAQLSTLLGSLATDEPASVQAQA